MSVPDPKIPPISPSHRPIESIIPEPIMPEPIDPPLPMPGPICRDEPFWFDPIIDPPCDCAMLYPGRDSKKNSPKLTIVSFFIFPPLPIVVIRIETIPLNSNEHSPVHNGRKRHSLHKR